MEVCVRIKNELGRRVRKDLELQNLTVPAQWLGVFAAIVHGIGSLRLLYLSCRYNWFSGWFWNGAFAGAGKVVPVEVFRLVSSLAEDINRMILPFGAVVVEVPYLNIRFPGLIKVFVCWQIFVIFHQTILNFVTFFFSPRFRLTAWSTICLITSWVAVALMFNSLPHLRRINQSTSAAPKTVFYASMAGIVLVRTMYYFPYMFDVGLWILMTACILYGFTAALYGCAWYRGHGVVASRVLGGSGVEPIALAFPGQDSGYVAL
ncbi:hypothetical protein E8E14_002867 [Neopestalotiopsis sp. 37M]|nr:hypothetical protein E8E14_002867 [Neopestalotiopsis sp. 37M]